MPIHLYDQPLSTIATCLALAMVAACEIGFRLGRRATNARGGDTDSATSTMQSALLALLGLLLAFTFGMANDRFESRKEMVLAEANGIGTAVLRTDFLEEPLRSRSRAALVDYLRERARIYAEMEDAPRSRASAVFGSFLDSATGRQDALWAMAAEAAATDPHDEMVALYVAALNDVIDLHSARVAAALNHVPETALFLLIVLAVGCSASVGQSCGAVGHRHLVSTTAFSVLIVLVITVVMDLDRPLRGFIRVPQGALTALLEDLEQGAE